MSPDFLVVSSLVMGDELGTGVAVSVKRASVEAVLKGQLKKISLYLGKNLAVLRQIYTRILGQIFIASVYSVVFKTSWVSTVVSCSSF